ncbi:MAG: phosphoribosyl-ATP diphosphatase [Candidatus Saccharicenans sp.]
MIIPSIDLMNGKAVQLRQGKDLVLENGDPLNLAEKFYRYGPLAVIDLDAALARGHNLALIKKLCRQYECRVGGGLRTTEQVGEILAAGASRVIIGTAAWKDKKLNQSFLSELKSKFGKDSLILALDCLGENIMIKGWTENTGVKIFDIIPEASHYVSGFLVTCINREGCLQGTDLEFFSRIRKSSDLPVIAAGGITSAEEIAALSQLDMDVQLGMSIYTEKLKLPEAFAASLNWQKGLEGLLPTIVYDENGNVLMLAWSSPESLKKSLENGLACYYSRSRKKLWIKGETTGNFQELLRVRSDCDGDSLLFVVRQKGSGACHKGQQTCFGTASFTLNHLFDVIRERLENPSPGSYTASLDHRLVREKLLEEAGELVEAETPEEIIWEAADLLYFTLVLLARQNISFAEVLGELQRRHRVKKLKDFLPQNSEKIDEVKA